MRPFVPSPNAETISIKDAAEALGVSHKTLYAMSLDGRLPVRRIGKRVVVRRDVVEGLLGGPLPASPRDERSRDHAAV